MVRKCPAAALRNSVTWPEGHSVRTNSAPGGDGEAHWQPDQPWSLEAFHRIFAYCQNGNDFSSSLKINKDEKPCFGLCNLGGERRLRGPCWHVGHAQ
jgi:hypothetical protein